MPRDVFSIESFLKDFGLTSAEARGAGRSLLEEGSLTRPGKQNMARGKAAQAEQALKEGLARCCGAPACRERLAVSQDTRRLVVVERELCEVCGGSQAGVAVQNMARALRGAGRTRLLVVGGTPNQWEDLHKRLPPDIACEMVDGTSRVNAGMARMQMQRSDLVIVWGPTPLDHKVSTLYTQGDTPGEKEKTVVVKRRGLTSLAEAVIVHLKRTAKGTRR